MQYLTAIEVSALAVKTAKQIHLRIPPQAEVVGLLEQRESLPQFYSDGTLQLWVDKCYIAHSSVDAPHVHYIYLTARHINEERYSFRQARKERNNRVAIPRNIEKQFNEALDTMSEEKKFVIIEKSAVNGAK